MGINYEKMAGVARNLISANGKTVSHKTIDEKGYNVTTGEVSGDAVIRPVDIIELEFDKEENQKKIIATAEHNICKYDILIIDGVDYEIVAINEMKPADTRLCYELWVAI